jgi:hypothetical protein
VAYLHRVTDEGLMALSHLTALTQALGLGNFNVGGSAGALALVIARAPFTALTSPTSS